MTRSNGRKSRRRGAGEGSIGSYETKGGRRYRALWHEPIDIDDPDAGKRLASKGGFVEQKEAISYLRRVLTDLDEGKLTRSKETTFGEFAATWLDGFRGAATTKAGYRRLLRLHVLPTLGPVPLKAIRPTTLASLYQRLEDGTAAVEDGDEQPREPIGPNTVRKCHTLIGAILQAAVDDNLLATNSARYRRANPPTAREVRSAKPEITPWRAEELRLFLNWVVDEEIDPLRYAWVVAAHTGVRRGELLGLRWGDIDLVAGSISVRRSRVQVREKGQVTRDVESVPKSAGGHAGTHPIDIDDAAVAALRAQLRLMSYLDPRLVARDKPVFVGADGKMFVSDQVTKRFGAAVRRYNEQASAPEQIPLIRLHDLRHTHATLLLEAGVHPKVVQERLGHSTIAITMDLYSHVLPTTQRAAADAFGRLSQAPEA
ncbi:MAG: site-specific integrase [Cellulomonas sp.]|nr:site-specific integrase [Cellulomonas sp.]OJV84379.1 MAG: hypothetical protein BGO37_08095 [Cellulomonas sp. 73-92]